MAAIIFDFDCTIADNRDYFVEFIAREADKWPLTPEQQTKLKGKPLLGMARALGVPWIKLPGLYFKGRSAMGSYIHEFKTFKGMPELFEKLHSEGHELFILSNNSLHNIRLFLRHHDLRKYFMEVYGGVGVLGKPGMLHKLLRDNNLNIKNAITVGDEVRDISAAHAVGMRIVAVTWGLCLEQDLATLKPTAIAHNTAELLKILEEA